MRRPAVVRDARDRVDGRRARQRRAGAHRQVRRRADRRGRRSGRARRRARSPASSPPTSTCASTASHAASSARTSSATTPQTATHGGARLHGCTRRDRANAAAPAVPPRGRRAQLQPGGGEGRHEGGRRLRRSAAPGDLVGLYAYPTGAAHVDFTTDHAQVKAALAKIQGLFETPTSEFHLSLSEVDRHQRRRPQVFARVVARECAAGDTALPAGRSGTRRWRSRALLEKRDVAEPRRPARPDRRAGRDVPSARPSCS